MDWTNKNVHPSKVVQVGDEIEVMVLDIDTERRRISLGMKQCRDNPWQAFSSRYSKGDTLSGKIRSITDFGVFIGLDGGIDGLVHLSDLSWDLPGEQVAKTLNKGDDLTAVLLSIDTERERIALGVKQLAGDPFGDFAAQFGKGALVTGSVSEVDARQVTLQLADGITGVLRAGDVSVEHGNNLTAHFKVGDRVEASVVNVDRRNRSIQLSQKQRDAKLDQQALKVVQEQPVVSAGPTTIGDLIKAQMNKSDS
jgi:small subunit ribosomal protein S1